VSSGISTIWLRRHNRKRNRSSQQMNWFLKGILTCSAVLLVLAVLLIPTGIVRGDFQRRSYARARQVDELFNRNCARCHGADGRSDTPQGHLFNAPDFTNPEWWKKNSSITSTRTLRSVVTRGKAGMPAFGKKLTRSEINLLVDRIRSFRKFQRKS
jgi:mono/diheme cytochrome c family protein